MKYSHLTEQIIMKKCPECSRIIKISKYEACEKGIRCPYCTAILEIDIVYSVVFTIFLTSLTVTFASLGIFYGAISVIAFAVLRQLALNKFDLYMLPLTKIKE